MIFDKSSLCMLSESSQEGYLTGNIKREWRITRREMQIPWRLRLFRFIFIRQIPSPRVKFLHIILEDVQPFYATVSTHSTLNRWLPWELPLCMCYSGLLSFYITSFFLIRTNETPNLFLSRLWSSTISLKFKCLFIK